LKIGIVVEKFPSVSETFIYNKVEGLCKRGHQVVVFRNSSLNDAALEAAMQVRSIPNLTLVDIEIPKNITQLTRRIIANPVMTFGIVSSSSAEMKKRLLTALRKEYFAKNPCDIYHFEFSGLALNYQPIFASLNGKIVCSCRGTAEKVKPISTPGRKEKLQALFQQVDKIHCVSEDMADTIKQYGASAKKIFVNRPSIDTTFFTDSAEAKKETPQIISVGRLIFQKGYLIGLLAIKEVIKTFPNLNWTIVGDGPMKEEIQFYIHDLGLSSNVSLAGAKSKQEILALFHQSHIFFLPSVYEGIANAVLEAMAMKLAVVSSDCSGMKEVIHNDTNGMLGENYNAIQMAEFIKALLQNEPKRTAIGKAARVTIEQEFNINRQLDVFEEQYSKLVTTA
jgi:colanic acid/amylovoran biosynthesis glycosyltransferase